MGVSEAAATPRDWALPPGSWSTLIKSKSWSSSIIVGGVCSLRWFPVSPRRWRCWGRGRCWAASRCPAERRRSATANPKWGRRRHGPVPRRRAGLVWRPRAIRSILQDQHFSCWIELRIEKGLKLTVIGFGRGLEQQETGHGCGQSCQGLPARSSYSDQQGVASSSTQYPADAREMLQDVPTRRQRTLNKSLEIG